MKEARTNAKAASSVYVELIEDHSAISNHALATGRQPGARPREAFAKLPRAPKSTENALPMIFEVAAAEEPYYFKASELEEKPQVLKDVPSDLAHRLAGDLPQTAVLRLLINESGEIDQVIIDESSFSEANQRLIRDAFARMRFSPGKIAHSSVKSELKIEIMLEDIVAKPYSK